MIDEQEEPTAEAEAEEPTAEAEAEEPTEDAGDEAEDATVTVEDGPEDGPEAGGDDDGADVLDIDPAANVETADEPAVSAEELLEMPDAPERWDDSGKIVEDEPAAVSEERAQDAADAGAAAAAADAGEAPPAEDV